MDEVRPSHFSSTGAINVNKSYRTVWNATTGTWAAAPETARMRTKSKANSTMRSSVTAAVAVMAGVGGGTMSVDAMAQATGGGLNLCSNTTAANGVRYGQTFGALSNTVNANCAPINTSLPTYQGHAPSFVLGNNAGTNGATGSTPTASVMGATDGHLVLYGQNGVHISGPADFNNNVNMTNHRITGLAAGTAGTDAVNLNQLNSAIASAATASNPYVAISTGTYAAATAARAGSSATAIGANANATGISAVALGGNTVASATNGVALGTLARATGAETVAVGVSANAAANNATAMGRSAVAASTNTTAVGYNTNATGDGATVLGSRATANTANSIAIGQAANATAGGVTGANSSIAIGNGAAAGGTGSIMIGTNTTHSGSLATVVGANSSAIGGGAGTVLGSNSSAAGSGSVALGSSATASNANSVALGTGSIANANNTVSVGSATLQRRITNLAAGTANTDAVNVGQLNTAISNAANPYVAARGTTAANATGASSIAIGDGAIARNTTTAAGQTNIAIGARANTSGGFGQLALGEGASTQNSAAGGAIAIGRGATTTQRGVALGDGASVTAQFGVALGDGSLANQQNTVSVGNATTQRRIVNLAAGTGGTDAVNVSQLTGVTKALGGGAAVGADGSITNPTYNVGGTDYHNVGDALDALASSGIGNPNAVIYDDATKGTVTLGGTAATAPVALKNVADAKDDHDALNLGQLKNAGLVGDDGAGNLTSLAVTYDDATKDTATLAGASGTTLSNVKAGVADMDAVNVSQLKGSGLIGDDGKSIAAVTYDRNADGTPNYGSVTLGNGAGPTQVKNVADATDDHDALNLGQLKDTGLVGDDGSGKLTSLAVTYDDATKTAVTLGDGATPVAIHNVADGVLAADSKDAVNGSQLFATNTRVGDLEDSLGKGGVIDPVTGESLAVVYDSNVKDTVTLAGTNGTTLSNVKAGVADMDAVNVSQLKGSGLIGDDGKSIAAVTYDRNADGTPNYGTVTLGNGAGPTQVKNVADATDDHDALNLGQLKDTGLVGDDGAGNLTSLAVTYDGAAKDSVTLGGMGAAAPVAIHNVADGVLAADSKDAVNGSQLFATNTRVGDLEDSLGKGGVIDPVTGESLAVVYDSNTKDTVTLAGASGTTLSNVKAGVADMDAVNVSQLKGSGLIGDDGKSIAAVTYDRNADGTPNYGTVTLGNGAGPTQVKNVADATDDHDALNLGQLKDAGLVGDDGAGNLTSMAVTYDGSARDKVTLAGADGTTLSNVKAGVADMDAVNVSQLKDSGLIDPSTGKAIVAVTYDRHADGTPNYGSATLGNGTGPTQLKNVADAKDDGDALNLGQLKDAGLVGDDGSGNLTSMAVTYDGTAKDSVTLGGASATTPVALHNVADGVLAADSKDAVNGSQLFATNQNLGDLKDSLEKGGVIDPTTGESLAVVYDSAAKNSVTLGNAGVPVAIHNVAAGAVNATSHDAVNGSQLFTVSQSVADKIGGGAGVGADGSLTDPTYSVGGQDYHNVGDALGALDKNSGGNPLAVAYDSAAKDTVTLGGAGAITPVALKNVADAKDDGDALNLGQLKNAGLVGDDGAGNLTSMAVTYDGAARDKVTLAGVDGTTLSNVKAGVADMDAVNVSQLKDAGLIDPSTGKPIAAVTYDSAAKDSVTLGGAGATTPVALKNVADAKDDGDALNLGQLKNAGLVGDDGAGKLTSMAVTYDGAAKDTVTLGGTGAAAPVALKNVADGTDRHDAINVGQLQDAGLVAPVDPSNPGAGLTSLAVAYDGVAKDVVTLKGTDGTTLSNVKAGVADMDAVNVSQLKDAGLIDPSTGKSIAAVTYDRNPDGTPNYGSVTLGNGTGPTQLKNVADATDDGDALNLGQLKNAGLVGEDGSGKLTSMAVTYDSAAKDAVTLGGAGATTPVALKNVADGTDRNDAINLGQLQDAGLVAPVDPTNPGKGLTSLAVAYDSATQDVVTLKGTDGTTLTNVKAGAVTATSTDAINGAQLHGTAQSVADSLGGGSKVDADGKVTNPTYSLADPADASKQVAYTNVGSALENLDGRTTTNTQNITVINKQLGDSGLVDPVTGQSIAAVTYDRNTDGTPNMGSVTLGGAGATTPVALKNVADGTDRHDAINLGQLQDAGLVAPVDPTNPGAGLASLAVTYGKHADGSANFDQVTLAGANGTTISNVKAGAVSATSTDAINGAQLHGVSQSVAKSLGGGASVDADGNVTNPSYKVSDKTFDNVGDAIENISNSLVHGSIGLVQQDDTTRDITVAKDTDGTTVNFAGTAGNRVLTGVAAGAVSATSVDAVNGSQLHGTAQSVADVIGGGTTVDADGKLADTSIEVNGSKYKTVAEAVQAAAQYGATDSLAVRYDLNRDGTPNYGSVTLGGTGAAPVRLTNVADGASQYDAVNFGQLSELSDRIGGLDDRVGDLEQRPPGSGGPGNGGSGNDYFAGTDVGTGSTTPANAGAGTGNTAAGSGATIGTGANNATVIGSNAGASQSSGVAIGSGAKSAAEGATAIGSGSNASGNQSVAIGSGANASGSNSVALGAGSTAYSDDTVSVGSIDRTRTISNVSDGVNATDVATKGQLDRAMGGMQGQVNDLSRNAYSGIAAATALTMIPGVDPGKTISFGIGGATYKGYQAVAFGGEARITQNLKMKAGVGMSSGGNTVGVGASYQW
ncbi:YadA-like family protein [Burkholderia cenocepacia]|uniref:YadA-like family protein n=1 Tax=Burkholderia cenocepacia TaxID=95486 RepID=UPI0032C22B68